MDGCGTAGAEARRAASAIASNAQHLTQRESTPAGRLTGRRSLLFSPRRVALRAKALLCGCRGPASAPGDRRRFCPAELVAMPRVNTDLTSDMRHFIGPLGPLDPAAYAYVLNLCPSDL